MAIAAKKPKQINITKTELPHGEALRTKNNR